MASLGKSALVILAVVLSSACTSMQTMYFASSYQAIANANDPFLLPHSGEPAFEQVAELRDRMPELWDEGYALLGYSQVVSPLLTSLAPGYSTQWGRELGAARVVMETPRAGESNLHYYLVSYWGRVDPGAFALGASFRDLPEEILKLVGREFNLVMLTNVFPGTPAAQAGLRRGDVVRGVDGGGTPDARALTERVAARRGARVELNITRGEQELDLPVALAAPAARGATRIGFVIAPWLDTPVTDYSSLSVANLASANMKATMQRIEQDRRAYEDRSRAQLQANLNAMNARLDALESASGPTNRRGGSVPQQQGFPGATTGNLTLRFDSKAMLAQMDRNSQYDLGTFFKEVKPPKMWGFPGHVPGSSRPRP